MKWIDIDFNNKTWIIPKEDTKAKRTHVVPLSNTALNIIEGLKEINSNSDYVFSSPVKSNEPIRWIQNAKKRIQIVSGVEDFRPHDLRRTMASYTAQLSIDRTVLGKLLNHKGLAGDHQVTAIYDRYDYLKEKKTALLKWERQLLTILSDDQAHTNVYKLN